MTTLTVNLDDQASDGLDEINAKLEASAEASAMASEGANKLTESQVRQLVVIQKQVAGYSLLANTAIGAFGTVGTAGIKAFAELELAVEHTTVEITKAVIGAAASIAKTAIVSGAALKGLNAVLGTHKKATDEATDSGEEWTAMLKRAGIVAGTTGVAITDHAVGYKLVEKAATAAGSASIKAVTGVGPYVAAATIVWESYAFALARTGIETERLADGTVKITTNLDRVNAATEKFSSSIARDFGEAKAAAQALWETPIQWPQLFSDISAEFDASMTRTANQTIENVGLMDKTYTNFVISLRAAFMGMSGPQAEWYRQEVTSLREMSAEYERIQKKLDSQQDAYGMLSRANERLKAAQDNRAESARLSSLKTVDAIVHEEQATKLAAQAAITAGKFTAEARDAYEAKMTLLGQRRLSLEKEIVEEKKTRRKVEEEQYTAEMKEEDARIKRQQEVFDLNVEHLKKLAALRAGLKETEVKQNADTDLEQAKGVHAANKDLTAERMKAQGASEMQIKQQAFAADKNFADQVHATKIQQINDEAITKLKAIDAERWKLDQDNVTGINRKKADIKLLEDEEKVRADRIKKSIEENGRFAREQNKLDLDQKLQIEKEKFAAERERIEKVKALTMQSMQNGDAKKLMDAADPEKVIKAMREARANQAGMEQAERDRDLAQSGVNGNQKDMREFAKRQKSAMAKARQGFDQDFENGNIGQGEIEKGQADVTNQTLRNLQKQGKMNAENVQALTLATQTLANQQQAIDNNTLTLDNLIAAMKGQKNVSKQSLNYTQAQAGSLN